jgi:amino acid transporter
MLTSAWVLYGFHSAGGLAEETVNPTRAVPRAMIFAVGLTAIISAFWLFAMVLAIPDVAKTQAESTNAIAYIFDAHFPKWVTDLFLVAVLTAIFVCCLAVQVATTRLLFAYGRDKMIPASRFFGFVSLRTKTPLLSAAFVAVATIAILIYVNFGGSAPGVSIARVTAWATAGTYVVYQMVVFASMLARSHGYPKERAYFNLGRWGWPVSIAGFVYGVFMIINLSWPRTPTAAWYDNYLVIFSIGMVFVLGVIVYLIQRARGVDLAATIHELVETPAEAPAAEAEMPGPVGATPVSEAGTLEMAADEGTGMGSVSVDPPSGPEEPGGPQI